MVENSGKIERMTIRGFKSIREMNDLELKNINIIIGANGAGKSNFLESFKFLLSITRGELENYVKLMGGAGRVLHFAGRHSDVLQIRVDFQRAHYNVVLDLAYSDKLEIINSDYHTKLEVLTERGHLQVDDDSARIATTPPGYQDVEGPTSLRDFYQIIVKFKVYHFHNTTRFSSIRRTAKMTDKESLLSDGSNLAAFLYFLQEKYPEVIDRLEKVVKSVAPFFQRFWLKQEPDGGDNINLRWLHVGVEELFAVDDLSDGTLRFIALAALLLQPNPPPTIIIDEPELGLHPAAIAQLAAMIHQVSPEVQIIAATQSPTFASYFSWQDFIVVERKDEASTFRRLTEEEVKPWLDEFSMGAIWEMNLIGGQPK